MWSFGCIIAEFFNKKVFIKAENDQEYLETCLQLMGMPNKKI
jgi:hypothetical protein